MLKHSRYNLLSNDVNYKSVKRFIIVSSLSVFVYGILCFIVFFDKSPYYIAFLSAIVLFIMTLILPSLFGCYSYLITKRVVLPNLILFFSYNIFVGGLVRFVVCIANGKKHSFDMSSPPVLLAYIITVFSLVASLVTMWDYKSMKRKAERNFKDITDDGLSS